MNFTSPFFYSLLLKAIIRFSASFYFATLFYIFFLARRRRGPLLPWHKRHLNLVPLKNKIAFFTAKSDISGLERWEFYTDFLGNILLFIPFAFFLSFVFHVFSPGRIILVALLTSLSVELIQVAFGIGVADVDDIILNLAGAVAGALIVKLLFKLKPSLRYLQKH